MRAVAKFQFTTPSAGEAVAQRIGAVLDEWLDRKFSTAADGRKVIRRGNRNADLDRTSDAVDGRRRDRLTVLEPVEGGDLQTHVEVLAGAERTAFRCVLSIGSDGGVSPANVPLRAPRFIHAVVALDAPWTVGISGERVFAQSFLVGDDDVGALEDLIFSPKRRLPIVVVSELLGETLAGDLHDWLSQDLCGLAHTVRLSHEATWELTRRRGREWSCYNGAVRLFWPYRPGTHDFRVHPLWTHDQILARADSEAQARDRFRGSIARRIIEASTFVADDGAFGEFEVARTRWAEAQARATAEDDGDIHALADAYATENDRLRATVDQQNRDIAILRENMEALTIALRSSQDAVPQAASEAPPQTVVEAVAIARRELDGRVVIATETDADIADLNPAAGPPDKILRYLRTLGALADALTRGDVGQAVPIWLREQGVECSGDSESTKSSREGKQFRTRRVNGTSVECEFHAKPSDGVSPDRCVRIYFGTAKSAPRVRIGYIGRHQA